MHFAHFFIVHHQIVMLRGEWNPIFLRINQFFFWNWKYEENLNFLNWIYLVASVQSGGNQMVGWSLMMLKLYL